MTKDKLSKKIDKLTELVTTQHSFQKSRLLWLMDDGAEFRGLLKAIISGIERIISLLPDEEEDQTNTESPDETLLNQRPDNLPTKQQI